MIRWSLRTCTLFAMLTTVGQTLAAEAPRVSGAWARATPPGATVGAIYLRIEGGAEADRLIGAATVRAARVEFHGTGEIDGVVRMRATAAIEVPAGRQIELAPQGPHLMLLGLTAPLRAGERLPLTLRFERGGEREVSVQVRDATAGDEHARLH
jgi:copper(I)-binding protein